MSPALLLPFITNIAGTGFDVYDYVTDNGDGTTTISSEFVQLVAQAYQQWKDENADKFDGSLNMTTEGYYYFPEFTASTYYPNNPLQTETVRFTDIYSYFPCAVLLYNNTSSESGKVYYVMGYPVYYNYARDVFYCQSVLDDDFEKPASWGTVNPKKATRVIVDKSVTETEFFSLSVGWAGSHVEGAYITASSSSIPVYHDLAALKEGLRTRDFSAAYNYGRVPDMETSGYTGFYGGGDITVANEKLEGISDKLDELNETDKSIDDRLKDLLEWLGVGDGSPGGITGWLEKIYSRLSDILKQLKSIKRWTAIDTVIDGADAIADWLGFIHDILSDADDGMESAVATLSSALDGASGLLRKKFPFSVPWDIFLFVTLLSAEPEVPHFEVPFDFDVSALGMHVHYDFAVDFTGYQYLSDIFRTVLSMTYAVGLIRMTSGIVMMKKEG